MKTTKLRAAVVAVLSIAFLAGCGTTKPKASLNWYEQNGLTDPAKCKHDGGITWPYGIPMCAKCYTSWKAVTDQQASK